jgi:CRISPR-associated endonuclease/helicase Cas3
MLLVHSRFRAAERAALNARLRGMTPDDDIIIVATQAVEAGVDITSRDLFTELAPWASLVQRFGRCNRGGEYDDAAVRWIDIDGGEDTNLPLPYTVDALASARAVVRTLGSASPSDLPPVTDRNETPHVLRRKDLLDLFDTEPDLSGFDIDVSPYLRDPGGANVDVFWREFERPDDQPRPHRRELCPVPIGAARDHLKAVKQRANIWNSLAAKWQSISHGDLRPGQVLMLHSAAGGYVAEVGFVSGSRTKVSPAPEAATSGEQSDSMDADPDTAVGTHVELTEHLLAVHREAVALAALLPMAGAADAVTTAALWHDTGKAHPAFQTAILAHAAEAVDRTRLWAKSADTRRRLDYGLIENGELLRRRFFRHEVASMLAWIEAGAGVVTTAEGDDSAAAIDADLVAYLIAAHHGKVRLALRALPRENKPPDDRLHARGVWDGDTLPPIAFDGVRTPPLTLRLDLMQLGDSDMGASWSARTARLLSEWGPFRLAWLETMVRLADWRGSRIVPGGSEAET